MNPSPAFVPAPVDESPEQRSTPGLPPSQRWDRAQLERWLLSPLVNRVGAAVLVALHAVRVGTRFLAGHLDFVHAGSLVNFALYAYFALTRDKPERVTLSPVAWFVTLASSWSGFALTLLRDPVAAPVVSDSVLTALSTLSIVAVAWSRISLGKAFGLAPARRRLVRRGAYRFVRHPIYLASFLSMVPVVLRYFSWLEVALAAASVGLMVWRALMEERFLAADEEYRQYMRDVPCRFVPFVL